MRRLLCAALGVVLLLTSACAPGDTSPPTAVLPPATAPPATAAGGDSTAADPPAALTATALPPVSPTPALSPTPELSPTPDVPIVVGDAPRFAVDPIDQSGPEAIAALSASGAQMVRLFVAWATIEPAPTAPSGFDWSSADAALGRLGTAGLQTIVSIQSCPAWACSDYAGPIDKVPEARFAEFVAALVTRYSPAPYHVHYWEFFNEPDTTNPPNHQGSFGLHGADYAAMLRAAVPGLRAIDPQARVLIGGLAYEWFMDESPPGPFNRNFLRDVVAAGGGAYFDYLNFHYYPQNPHFPTIADKAAALRQLAHSLGIDKPLICTEVGLTSSTDPRWQAPGWPLNNEQIQSRFLVETYVQGLAGGLTSVTWFTLHDWASTNPGLQIFLQTGLTRSDWSYKPALTAYHMLVHELTGQPFIRSLGEAALGTPELTGAAFGRPGTQVWVVWSRTGTPAVVSPSAGLPVFAYTLDGTAQAPNKGPLTVGPDPIYLEFRSTP